MLICLIKDYRSDFALKVIHHCGEHGYELRAKFLPQVTVRQETVKVRVKVAGIKVIRALVTARQAESTVTRARVTDRLVEMIVKQAGAKPERREWQLDED